MLGSLFNWRERVRVAAAQAPSFEWVPPRGGEWVASIRADQQQALIAALDKGHTLELGQARALRLRHERYLVQTALGSDVVTAATQAVERLIEDAQARALAVA